MRDIERELEAILPYLLKVTRENGQHTYLSGDMFELGFEMALMNDTIYRVFIEVVKSGVVNDMDVVDVWCLLIGYGFGQQELIKIKKQMSSKFN